MTARLVIGPPGTGKTTRLLSVLDELLSSGHRAADIAAVSFTRAAVREIQRRAEDRFGLDLRPRSGGKVGTIHSLCYWGLGLAGGRGVFGRKEWREFCGEQRIAFTDSLPSDDEALYEPWEPPGALEGDVFRAWYDWARNGLLDLEEAARRYDPGYAVDFDPTRMLRLAQIYEQAKAHVDKPDFCDLLSRAVDDALQLNADVLLVDEAQDLSPLQRRVVEMWAAQAESTWYFFDPDQCIYSWQHAEPSWLLQMDGETEFLSQSWRVPVRIAAESRRLIARNRQRYPHDFEPRKGDEGQVRRGLAFADLLQAISSNGETWGLLARNRFLLSQYTEPLFGAGVPYVNLRGRSPMTKVPGAVTAAVALALGETVSLRDVRILSGAMPAGGNWANKAELERMAKANPDEAASRGDLLALGASATLIDALGALPTAMGCLTRIESARRDYYLRVIESHGVEALERRAAVTVSTIHGVKGREYDNVIVLPDWATRTQDGAEEDPEAERRVWYVAYTRARRRLFVLEPTTRLFNEEVA